MLRAIFVLSLIFLIGACSTLQRSPKKKPVLLGASAGLAVGYLAAPKNEDKGLHATHGAAWGALLTWVYLTIKEEPALDAVRAERDRLKKDLILIEEAQKQPPSMSVKKVEKWEKANPKEPNELIFIDSVYGEK